MKIFQFLFSARKSLSQLLSSFLIRTIAEANPKDSRKYSTGNAYREATASVERAEKLKELLFSLSLPLPFAFSLLPSSSRP